MRYLIKSGSIIDPTGRVKTKILGRVSIESLREVIKSADLH